MPRSLRLADATDARDLRTSLSRAERIERAATRLVAGGGVLAAYTAVLQPTGLLDDTPTVLGLRVLAAAPDAELDEVVPIVALTERLRRATPMDPAVQRGPVEVALPEASTAVAWAGVAPPRGGWAPVGRVDAARLLEIARSGAAEVASAVPDAVGEHIVRRVRASVWGRPVEGVERVPAGAAFALSTLGFLVEADETVPVLASGTWLRLSSARGHVLVRSRSALGVPVGGLSGR